MPGLWTAGDFSILRQLQEKYVVNKKDLFFAFVDLEKVYDRVPKDGV